MKKMKVHISKLLLLASHLFLITSAQLFNFGSQENSNKQLRQCTTPSGSPGLCQDVTNCPALLLDLRTLVQSICFQSLFRPGTCCPLKTAEDITESTETTTTTESTSSTTPALQASQTPIKLDGLKKITTPAIKNQTTTTERPTPVSFSRPPLQARFGCGVSKATQARVVNGTESYPGQWPWMAAIYLHGFLGSEFHCGGTVISREYIVTAAHCMIDKRGRRFSPSQFSVRLGDHDISTMNDRLDKYVQSIKVQTIQIHEDFENFNHQYFRNDIALLKLTRPINFSPYVLPVCLPSKAMAKSPVDALSGEIATVIGYGRISYSGPQSKKLLKAAMPIWWNKACDDAYFPPILETNVCSGYVEGGIDSCQGDSGGPLLIYRHRKWVLLGIVSFGQKCAEPGYPGVYTRVPKFLDWIQKKAQN